VAAGSGSGSGSLVEEGLAKPPLAAPASPTSNEPAANADPNAAMHAAASRQSLIRCLVRSK
jgi:hypothetical protein